MTSAHPNKTAHSLTPNPTKILETGFGFWGSKVLLTAVELELFTKLGSKGLRGDEIEQALKLHPRGTWDFLDALVAMGFLDREGDGVKAIYSNTTETAEFLDKTKSSYIGGILEMLNARLFNYWNDLGTALKTGQPQNEIKHHRKPMFEELYSQPERLEQFMSAMRGLSMANFSAFAEKFDFSKYKTLCDVGGATGLLSSLVAKQHAHMQCITFDLPPVAPIAKKWLQQDQLLDRVDVVSGDFLKGSLAEADVITMGMILHDWNLEKKKHLIKLAYDALPAGGAFVAIENLIDDARRQNAFGLLMSLNMLIEFGDAFDFTGADFKGWCKEAGFKKFEVIHLAGPCSAAVAYK